MASVKYKNGPSLHYTWKEVNPRGFSGMGLPVRTRAIAQAQRMEKLRAAVNQARKSHGKQETGIAVLSWWRPVAYNKQIHGAVNSRHIKGDACDISLQEIQRLMPWPSGQADFDKLCQRIWPDGGFGTYPGGSRHVDCRGYKARWSSYRRQ